MELIVNQNRNAEFGITIQNGEEYITLLPGEKLIFGVKKYQASSTYMIYRELTSEDMEVDEEDRPCYSLTLSADETNLAPGHYYWDMVFRTATDMIAVFEADDFIIKGSVINSNDRDGEA